MIRNKGSNQTSPNSVSLKFNLSQLVAEAISLLKAFRLHNNSNLELTAKCEGANLLSNSLN